MCREKPAELITIQLCDVTLIKISAVIVDLQC